ncbi:MAG: COX15/CtaA family protein [Hyphomicrobiaceae bacterium]
MSRAWPALAARRGDREAPATVHWLVRPWLYGIAALIFAVLVVGGATRLTGSGLSITEWQPIMGIVPPLSEQDWQTAFAKYKQIPQYREINRGMSLAAFKQIFWWEWLHRFLARMIGFAFAIPLAIFWLRRHIDSGLALKLLAILALGGLQGFIGWIMVASGLVDRTSVSHYRLTIHLGLAILILGLVFLMARSMSAPEGSTCRSSVAFRRSAYGLAGVVYLQILLGALVAGLHAGLSHNTWPLMDGRLIPNGLGVMSPWYVNLFENVLTVQFNHRMLAYILVIWASVHFYLSLTTSQGERIRFGAGALVAALLLQVVVGIYTLITFVPVMLALLHQATAVFVLLVAFSHAQDCWLYRHGEAARQAAGERDGEAVVTIR